MFSHSPSNGVSPGVHTAPSVFQFVSTGSGHIPGHHRKESDSLFFAPSVQVFVHIDDFLPQAFFTPG